MEALTTGRPYEGDYLVTTKEIDDFFKKYPLEQLENKLSEFRSDMRHLSESRNEINFYEDLWSILKNLKNSADCFYPQTIEPCLDEQTLVCLEGVINLIKQAIPVGSIYNLSGDKTVLDLIIVLERSCTKAYSDFEHVIDLATLGYETGTCTIHNYGLLNKLIQNGHLFYHTACIEKNVIYKKSNAEAFICNDVDRIIAAKLEAEQTFEKGIAKAVNFYDGAQHYIEADLNDMAMFMLHQACELTYRCLLNVLRGKDVKCHSPAVLLKHLKRFAPAIVGIFDALEEKELDYLQVLEDAYVKSRYNRNYNIENELLIFLNQKIALLQQTAIHLFNEKMEILADQIVVYKQQEVA